MKHYISIKYLCTCDLNKDVLSGLYNSQNIKNDTNVHQQIFIKWNNTQQWKGQIINTCSNIDKSHK